MRCLWIGAACLLSGFAVGLAAGSACGGRSADTRVNMPELPPAADTADADTADADTADADTAAVVELNDTTLMRELRRVGVSHPEIVLAQAKLETGNYRSRLCVEGNNLFGLRHKKGYYCFDTWQESVQVYKDRVQCRYEGGDYLKFLERIGYAENPEYTVLLRKMLP